jgi:hypothetical protein
MMIPVTPPKLAQKGPAQAESLAHHYLFVSLTFRLLSKAVYTRPVAL